jgi:hypothetical protein
VKIYKDKEFEADLVVTYTIYNAPPFGYTNSTMNTTSYLNTAQLIVAADRKNTYSMYIYENVSWPDGMRAFAGATGSPEGTAPNGLIQLEANNTVNNLNKTSNLRM